MELNRELNSQHNQTRNITGTFLNGDVGRVCEPEGRSSQSVPNSFRLKSWEMGTIDPIHLA